jgi:hypothetical protein
MAGTSVGCAQPLWNPTIQALCQGRRQIGRRAEKKFRRNLRPPLHTGESPGQSEF